MMLRRPFPLAVLIGFGTVFAISLLLILLPNALDLGMPIVLYDVGGWMRNGLREDPILRILPFLSLIGYLEAGLMYAFFANREASKKRKEVDLVEEVGKDDNATASYPQKGAIAGALVGLFASLASLPVLLIMTYIEMQNPTNPTAAFGPDLIGIVMVGNVIAGVISLTIAVVLGTILGALGGVIGSRMKPQTA